MNSNQKILWMIVTTISAVACAHVSGIRPKAPFAAAGPGALVIAHRGGSLEAPENTLSSIAHGVAAGSDWQELDVALTRDQRVVVIHDATVDRTTNGHGAVASLSLAQVGALRAGNPRWDAAALVTLKKQGLIPPDFADQFADERVPSLADVLKIPDARLMIELKKSPQPARLAAAVVQMVHEARASDRVVVGSHEFELVDALHQLDPSLPLVGIIDSAGGLERMLDLPVSVLAADKASLDLAMSGAPPGVAVWVWTAYSATEAEDLALRGAHGILTDSPTAVLRRFRPDDVGQSLSK